MKNEQKYIDIKGNYYSINFFTDERDYLGRTDFKNKEILVYINQCDLEIAKTIHHELMHAYFYECGLLDFAHNEILVTFLGETFLEILDNQGAIEDYAKNIKKNVQKGVK